MYLQQFFVEGLGCASYLVGCEAAGVAAVIDPERDVQQYIDAAAAHRMRITTIIETHLHADHVSGNTDLAARTGAEIVLSIESGAEFPHRAVREGDVITIGNVEFHVRQTPGHTPESITLLVVDKTRGDEAWLALTGDTLFVGDVGRPDLVGADAARRLAGNMYDTLFGGLLKLDDSLLIYPGHGSGSLCGRSIGAMRSTTLGYERRHNPSLTPRTREDFIVYATHELPTQPGSHTYIKAQNRRGPQPLGVVKPILLTPDTATEALKQGAAVLDVRRPADFARGHIAGAVNLKGDDQLSNRIGFVLPPETPIILVGIDENDARRITFSLARVGYQDVRGYLPNLDAWAAAGKPLINGGVKRIDSAQLNTLLPNLKVLDVREGWEYELGHVPGAQLIPLGMLLEQLSADDNGLQPDQPIAVICEAGSRSRSAAALLYRRGFKTVYDVSDGTDGWKDRGLPMSVELQESETIHRL